jgi:hypothetical protein
MIRNAALLSIILLAAPVVAAAEPPNPMATPTPTPGPKINTELKIAPGILLARPKAAACPGAQSTAILLASCSGAPGTHLTLTLGNTITPVGLLFKQNAGGKMTNYSATVGRSAGAYTVTVPPLCNGGSPSFSLVASYIPLVQGRASVTKDLGNFTAICGQTAQATASPAPTPTASPSPKPTASPAPVPATVQAAVDLLTGSRDAVVSSSCGTTPSFNCPNGTPRSSKIRIARNAVAISQNPAGGYSFSATESAASLSDIPFIYSGINCSLTINTQGSSPAIVTGTLTFASQNPGGPLNQLILNPGLQFSVAAGDLSVSGCTLMTITGGSDVAQTVASRVLESALHDRMGNSVCIVQGPALVGPCQRH